MIERLLGFEPVPVPPHVFRLTAERLSYAQLGRHGRASRLRALVEAPLPPDAFYSGHLGGPLRDPAAFSALLADLLAKLGPAKLKSASLVLPDAWLRVVFAEITDLPRAGEPRDEVLRWKLRRLVPYRVEDLRVAAAEVTPLARQEEPRRVLLGFGNEHLLAQLEDAFDRAGVRLGQVTSASLALVSALDAAAGEDLIALVLVGDEDYALVFVRRGEPVLHRYKASSGTAGIDARGVVRDLRLTRTFLEEHYPGVRLARAVLAAPPELEPLWLDRLTEGLGEVAEPLDGRHLPPLQLETPGLPLPLLELAPMMGAARREVA